MPKRSQILQNLLCYVCFLMHLAPGSLATDREGIILLLRNLSQVMNVVKMGIKDCLRKPNRIKLQKKPQRKLPMRARMRVLWFTYTKHDSERMPVSDMRTCLANQRIACNSETLLNDYLAVQEAKRLVMEKMMSPEIDYGELRWSLMKRRDAMDKWRESRGEKKAIMKREKKLSSHASNTNSDTDTDIDTEDALRHLHLLEMRFVLC